MIVISDASPLIILAATGDLNLLKTLFQQVHVPVAVREEITGDPDLAGAQAVKDALEAGWLVPASEDAVRRDALAASHGIGKGEAAALALAQATEEALVLLDDRKARRVAGDLGVRRCGTIRVFELAHESGDLPDLDQAYLRLVDSPGRFSLSLLNASLARHGFGPIAPE